MSQAGQIGEGGGPGSGAVDFLTGNNAINVGPNALGIVNLVGTGPISVTGNSATNTLTISLTGGSDVISITGDAGPALTGSITITGGTSGAVYTGVAIGETLTTTFNYLSLPNTTAGGNGIIYLNSVPYFSNYNSNLFVGANAGNLATTGSGANTAVGYRALVANTTGSSSVAIGYQALTANTVGGGTAVGYQSMFANVSGSSNTGFGYQTLLSNVSGSANVAVGTSALAANTASNLTAIGYNALTANTSGTLNTAVGYLSLAANLTGSSNTAIGYGALAVNTSNSNVAVGTSALANNSSGFNNVGVGASALIGMLSGADNVAIGSLSLRFNTSGTSNIGLGAEVFANSTTGSYNIGMGLLAGSAYSGAESSNIVLSNAGVVGESNVIRIGTQGTGTGQQSACYVAGIVGTTVTSVGSVVISSTGQLGVGSGGGAGVTSITGNAGPALTGAITITGGSSGAVYTGVGVGETLTTTFNYLSLPNTTAGGNGIIYLNSVPYFSNYNSNLFVGANAGNLTTTGTGENTAVGYQSLTAVTSGSLNTSIGYNTLLVNTIGDSNAAVGSYALYSNIGGNSNVAIGASALASNTGGDDNVAIGNSALSENTTSGNLVAVGAGALSGNTSGNYNTGVGYTALNANTGGTNNTSVGYQSLFSNQASNNTGVGFNVLVENTSGGNNSAFGSQSLSNLTTGSYNTALGYAAGGAYTGAESNNLIIGSIGIAGESNILRIGTSGTGSGQQSQCFIAGIVGTGVTSVGVVNVSATGQLGIVVSAERFKEDIKDLGDSDFMKLRPVSFKYKEEKEKKIHYGFVAEEVEKVFPSLVIYDEDKAPYTVAYHEIAPLLLAEIQKLRKEVDALKRAK